MSDKYDAIKIDHQLCFPLYACAKEIVRRYKPFLDEIDAAVLYRILHEMLQTFES